LHSTSLVLTFNPTIIIVNRDTVPTLLFSTINHNTRIVCLPFFISFCFPDLIADTTDSKYGPVYISVSVTPSKRVLDTGNHPSSIQQRLKPTSELLKQKEGDLIHKVEVDGEAKICVRASGATNENNMRFGLKIDIEDSAKYKDENEGETFEGGLDGHLSHMEMEMKRIRNGMQTILSEADFSKEREAVFHQNTESMHAASTFWPIVQTCVLIMTGFTQARHIVMFFQTRRII